MSDRRNRTTEYGQAKGEASSRPSAYASDIQREREAASRNLKKTGRLRSRIQKRSRRSKIYMTISCAVIAVTVIIAFSIFFSVNEIEVSGCGRYTPEEIIKAAGINKGDNLLLLNKFSVIDRMLNSLVYLDNVEIRRVFPDKLRITVTETFSVFAFEIDGGWWLANADGRLLDFSSSLPENIILIAGIALNAPAEGQIFSAGEADMPLKELLSALDTYDLLEGTSLIDMEKLYNAYIIYEDYTIVLGKSGDYKESCRIASAAVSDLSSSGITRATLDISTGKLCVSEDK